MTKMRYNNIHNHPEYTNNMKLTRDLMNMKNWVQDIYEMHEKFGVHDWIDEQVQFGNKDKLNEFLRFRIRFLHEELAEMGIALDEKNPEEIVDALIDLCVVAIGTLDAFNVDAHKAWKEVHTANMAKQPGVKESRPNPLGLPDLIKPEGWKGPSHEGNHEYFTYAV
mgnify:FL=1